MCCDFAVKGFWGRKSCLGVVPSSGDALNRPGPLDLLLVAGGSPLGRLLSAPPPPLIAIGHSDNLNVCPNSGYKLSGQLRKVKGTKVTIGPLPN